MSFLKNLFSAEKYRVKKLINALRSDDYNIAYSAAKDLKNMKLPETTSMLMKIVSKSDTKTSARKWAIEVLGSIGDLQTTEVLLPLLKDPLFEIRRTAAIALSQLDWEPSSPQDMALRELCTSGNDLVFQADIDAFIGRVKILGTSAIEPLLNAINTCKDWRVGRAATEALASIGGDKVLQALYGVVNTYDELHDNDTGNIRRTAALAIAQIETSGRTSPDAQLMQTPDSNFPPKEPLIKVEAIETIRKGQMIRVWHDYLGQWATKWLEVMAVVDDLIILKDSVTGEDVVRHISDTIPCWQWPIDRN
jgi:HEAT repeat protein